MTTTPLRPMRILIASQNYAPEPTGIGKYSGEMAAWFAGRGHDVHVIAAVPHYPHWRVPASFDGTGFSTRLEEGVTVHRVPVRLPTSGQVTTRARIALETSFSLASTRWWLPRLFGRSRPDVIVAVSPPTQTLVWPLAYAKLRRVPVIAHFQDLQVDAAVDLGMIRGATAKRILLRAEAGLLAQAQHVTTISNAMLERVRAKGVAAARSTLFPNWSNLEAVRPMPPDQSIRSRLGASAEDVLFIYSGNLGEKQGLEVVLSAARRLLAHPGVKVAIVGAGANRRSLEASARRMGAANVGFHDLFAAADLGRLLSAADVHLVVQRREAADLVMPSKLTNILASGRACIATADDETELGHVVRTSGCGILVAPEDADALSMGMLALARDPVRRARCGDAARRYAESHLDHEAVLRRFEQLLARVADAHR